MLAFVHIEKCAGSTMSEILRRSFGLRHIDVYPFQKGIFTYRAEDHRILRRFVPWLSSIAGHTVRPSSDLDQVVPGIRYYTLLREPLARCASHFQYEKANYRDNIRFEDWMVHPVFRNFQTQKIAGGEDLDKAIRIVDQELLFTGVMDRFDESMVILQRLLGDAGLDIRYVKRNVASDNRVKSELMSDPSKRKLLEANNALDVELYRYVKETVYPRYQQAYGPTLEADVAAFQQSNAAPTDIGARWRYAANSMQRALIQRPLRKCYWTLRPRAIPEHPPVPTITPM
jgi:hypothetical protein